MKIDQSKTSTLLRHFINVVVNAKDHAFTRWLQENKHNDCANLTSLSSDVGTK